MEWTPESSDGYDPRMEPFLSIGEVAARTGESRDTIRYYERAGLVPPPIRTAAGYRQYRAGIVNRLALIRNAQRFGFSLREIRGFLGGNFLRVFREAVEAA